MGRVYLGRSPGGKTVAVKVINPRYAADRAYRERFRLEAKMARQVNGAYTAAVLSAEPDAALPWIVIDFVFGPSLAKAVEQRGPLSPDAVWCLAGGMVEALRAVHAEDLVHRDLKPGNVLLDSNGPKVIDFGIARGLAATATRSPGLTLPGSAVGTPGYMSPEQSMGSPVGMESDVFSLGCVLVFAATGSAPEVAETRWATASNQPGMTVVPADLRRLVEWCLAYERRDRPTLDQLMRAVQNGRPGYSQARGLGFWPEPMASRVRSDEARIRRGISAGPQQDPDECPPTVQERQAGDGNLPKTKKETRPFWEQVPTATLTRRSLPMDDRLFAAYRPRLRSGIIVRRPGEALDAAAHALEGDRHWAHRRYLLAEDSYRASLGLDHTDSVIHVDLGRAICHQERHGDAERAFADALQHNSGLIAAWRNRYLTVKNGSGRRLDAEELHEKLIDACHAVLELDTYGAAGHANRGDALCCLSRDDEAWHAYQAALVIDPDNPRLREKLDYASKRMRGL